MVAVTWLMTTDTLYIHFTILFELAFGAVFQAAKTYLLLNRIITVLAHLEKSLL